MMTMSSSAARKKEGGYSSGLPHPPDLEGNVRDWLRGLDSWTLASVQAVTMEAKSLLVGAAVVAEARGGGRGRGAETSSSPPPFRGTPIG